MQRRIAQDGMQELLSNLQIWSFVTPRGVKADKVLKDLARDVKKCEKLLTKSDEEEEEESTSTQVSASTEDDLVEAVPTARLKGGGLKLTISTAFAATERSADLTDRDSVKKLMSLSSSSSPPAAIKPLPAAKKGKSRRRKKATKAGKATSELERELDSAVMDFGLEEGGGEDEGEFQVQPCHELVFRSTYYTYCACVLQIDTRPTRRKRNLSASALRQRAEEDEAALKAVHRDKDFIYPSLDVSDDELPKTKVTYSEQGTLLHFFFLNARVDNPPDPTMQVSKKDRDSNYSPKVHVRDLGSRERPPPRDHAKVVGIERGLQAAREAKQVRESGGGCPVF